MQVADVDLMELDPTAVEDVREVGEPPTPQVIDHANAEPTGQQGIDGVAADEPRPARHENPLARPEGLRGNVLLRMW